MENHLLDDLGLADNSSQHSTNVYGANVANLAVANSLVSNISVNSTEEPMLYSQQSHDIWKGIFPSAAALISNSVTAVVSAAASSTSPLFVTTGKPEPEQQIHFPDESTINETISGSISSPVSPIHVAAAANPAYLEHVPNVSADFRLSSTLSVHSGGPTSVLLNSISNVAASTGGYWDSFSNATFTEESAFSTADGVTDLDYELYPEDELRVSVGLAILFCVAYGLVFIVGIVGNSFVVAVVFRSPRMRTPTNFFIANLAVADLLVVLFCLPATLIANIYSG